MKTKLFAVFAGFILVCPAFIPKARAQANSWTNKVRGNFYKWEDGSKWSLGVPPSTLHSSVFITNNPTGGSGSPGQTINIDATTVLSNAINGCMSLGNLVLSTPSAVNLNRLLISNTGTNFLNFALLDGGGLFISNRCTVTITNSSVIVSLHNFGGILDSGSLILNTGTIDSRVTIQPSGQMLVVDGYVFGPQIFTLASTNGTWGTLTVEGGFVGGGECEAFGNLWLSGGTFSSSVEMDIDNGNVGGAGQMIVSNGTWQSASVLLGISGQGSLSIFGGDSSIYDNLLVGTADCVGRGVFLQGGGTLSVTNSTHTGVLLLSKGAVKMNGGTLNTDQMIATNSCEGTLLITGSGSVWSNADVFAGSPSTVVSLVVSNGAQVINTHDLNLGLNSGELPSLVTVTGSGTVWSNQFGVTVGNFSGGNVLSINGGAVMVSVNVALGDNAVASTNNSVVVADAGSVWSTFVLDVGFNGSGNSMVISNGGTVFGTFAVLGSSPGANNNSVVVSDAGSTWSNGASIVIGNSGAGASVTVTNGGVVLARNVPIGEQSGGGGQLNVSAGGTVLVSSNVTLGNYACSGTGNVVVTDGSLYVTNGAGNGVLEVRSGTFILNSGTVAVDRFVMTNACAHFVRTGGTLIYGSAILSSNLDADGDGIPSGYELAHGLDPLNNTDAALDNDGDGFSNLQEFHAGTDPNSASSTPFIATAIAQQGNNIVLTWTTLGGTTNRVQFTNGGYATNGFVDLGAPLIIGGSGLVATNYTDVNAATNFPSRYYRVRLVP